MTMKSIFLNKNNKEIFISGATKAADIVRTTLGPKGQTVIIESPHGGAPILTKDGVSVAKNIEFECPLQNKGAQIILSAAKQADDPNNGGDGTTTSTVITAALLEEINKIPESMQKREVAQGILKAKTEGINFLNKHIQPISKFEDLANVTTISANNNHEMGNIVAKAFLDKENKIQKNCVVTITEGQSVSTELEKKHGMELDTGYISPYFINDTKKQICDLRKTHILITDQKISSSAGIIKLLESNPKLSQGGTLLIIAEDIDGEALSTLIINKMRGVLKISAIKAPAFGDRRKEILQDIAILTNGTVLSPETGYDLDNIDANDLGFADSITVNKDKTIITGGAGDKDELKNRCEIITAEMANTSSDYDKEKLEERLANLEGRISVISVGGDNEMDVKEKKDRFQDALNSAKAAIESGILPGGGTAHLRMASYLETLNFDNENENYGKKILCNALKKVMHVIIKNTGKTDHETFDIISSLRKKEFDFGYDAHKETSCNMKEHKIIDAAKITLNSLNAAISTIMTIINTSAIIYKETSSDDKNAPANPNPMMGGGMPGMY